MSHKLTPEDIGRRVIYRCKGGQTREAGVLFGYNEAYVFVRYDGDEAPKATDPADLTFEPPPASMTVEP